MKFWGIKSKLQIWIAIFAILTSSLAPSISHALAAMDSTPGWATICSAAGTKYAADGIAIKDTSAKTSLHKMEHCPYCSGHTGAPALPVAIGGQWEPAATGNAYPPLFYQAPHPLFSWSQANPRGPPAIS